MKKILLLVTASIFAFQFSNAQTEKGNHTLGIDLGFSYGKSNETLINSFDSTSSIATTKITNFSVGPNYSYFIADKLDIGVSLQYKSGVENDYPIINGPGEKMIMHNYGASIYLRKYFMYGDKIGLRTGRTFPIQGMMKRILVQVQSLTRLTIFHLKPTITMQVLILIWFIIRQNTWE